MNLAVSMKSFGSSLIVTLALLATSTAILAFTSMSVTVDQQKEAKTEELYAGYQRSFSDTPAITVQQLLELSRSKQGPLIVDVRTSEERLVSRIPGSISWEEFERKKLDHRGRQIVTYCTIGYRSGLYAEKLREEEFAAFNLAGSILSWLHAGQGLVDDEGDTKRVHVYGHDWDLAPTGWETTWFGKSKAADGGDTEPEEQDENR